MENGEDQESHRLENSFTPQEENFHSNVAPRALNLRLAAALLKCHSTRLRNVNDLDDDKILNQFLGRSTIRKLRQLLQLGQCRELEAHRHDKNIFGANGERLDCPKVGGKIMPCGVGGNDTKTGPDERNNNNNNNYYNNNNNKQKQQHGLSQEYCQ
mmetsp:Transcript_29776/g.47748  ORF Transcript_29776/g.47748 Transcript_29776/m.47748 type:complete len:156 (-) Transcript_29776:1316-1783(-)